MWEPTPPGFLPALQPFWGENRPYAIAARNICDPGPPPAFSTDGSSDFYTEAVETYEAVNNLTQGQETIALFWADDPGVTSTPPGHSVSILTQLLEQQGAMLDTAAEAYAKLGMAVSDGFVSCWHSKYRYTLLRPITYINRYIDADWGHPLPVETPPFPEYPSGHLVQSGAAAQVLTDLFGNVAFTDHTHDDRGFAPRSFNSFSAFADEAAISRLYGGIHFRSAIELGLGQGRCVGQQVHALRFRR